MPGTLTRRAKKGLKRNKNSHDIIRKIAFLKFQANLFGRLLLDLTIVRGAFRTLLNIFHKAYLRNS